MTTAADPAALDVRRPETAADRGRSVVVGPRSAHLLARLVRTPSIALRIAKRDVWGDAATADATVRVLLCRLNEKLLEIGCPARVGIDRGHVRLTWPPPAPAVAPEGARP